MKHHALKTLLSVSLILCCAAATLARGAQETKQSTASAAPSYRAEFLKEMDNLEKKLVSLAEAMVRLRAQAYTEERRLGEVARDVVAGTLQLDAGSSP